MFNRRLLLLSVLVLTLSSGTGSIRALAQETKPGRAPPLAVSSEPGATAERPPTALQKPANYGGFLAFAFAPDGQTVADGTGIITTRNKTLGGEVILWNALTGRILRTLGQHGAGVDWVTFSADGKTLATASFANHTVKLWDPSNGKLRRSITLPGKVVTSGSFFPCLFLAPDGKSVIAVIAHELKVGTSSYVANSDLRVWDTTTGKEVWSRPDSEVRMASVSADSKSLIVFQARLADPREGPNGSVNYKLSGQKLSVLDAASGTPGRVITVDRFKPNGVLFLKDGKRVAASDFKELRIWDVESGQPAASIAWDRSRFASISLVQSVDGKFLARAGHNYVEVTDIDTGKIMELKKFEFPQMVILPAFTPNLQRLVSAGSDPAIYDLARLKAPSEVNPSITSSDARQPRDSSAVTPANYQKLKRDMTLKEVEAILGLGGSQPPTGLPWTDFTPGGVAPRKVHYYWWTESRLVVVGFIDGKLDLRSTVMHH